jgi:hypothetical protein
VDLALAMSASGKCAVVLLFTGVAAPIVGILLRHVADGWDSVGQGPFAIDADLPQRKPLELVSPVNRVVREAEARQMIEAKSYRRSRRGEAAIDVEAEIQRVLSLDTSKPTMGEELRSEIRELVVSRNERRMRQGRAPLDVEAEVERQVADFIRSP